MEPRYYPYGRDYVFDVAEDPIRHAVITYARPRETVIADGSVGPDEDDSDRWSISYLVPGSRIDAEFPPRDPEVSRMCLRDYPDNWIATYLLRHFPLFWRVVGVRWQGHRLAARLIERLHHDASVTEAIIHSKRDFLIKLDHRRRCWELDWLVTVETRGDPSRYLTHISRRALTPPKVQLDCYKAIARHLLETPIPTGK